MRSRRLLQAVSATAALGLVGGSAVAAAAGSSGPPPNPTSTNGKPVELVASGLSTPTAFAFGAKRVFVADAGSEDAKTKGGVFTVSKGKAVRVPGSPSVVFGLAWRKGTLYVSAGSRILAWSGWTGSRFKHHRTVYANHSKKFTGFNGIGIGHDGRLYAGVSVGNYDHSFSKAAPFLQDVVSMTRSGKNLTVVASGIRQPWQMAFPKGSSTPYVTDLGADAGRAKNPPDFVLRVRPGQNYGFPKCDWTKPSRCKGFARPWQSFAPHTDPMGIGLIGDRLYLSEFIANHGTGLVVSLPKKGGTPKTLMTGFVAPVVGLGTHRGYVYVGELTGQVFRVKAR